MTRDQKDKEKTTKRGRGDRKKEVQITTKYRAPVFMGK